MCHSSVYLTWTCSANNSLDVLLLFNSHVYTGAEIGNKIPMPDGIRNLIFFLLTKT